MQFAQIGNKIVLPFYPSLFFLFISDWYGGMHPQPHQRNQDDSHHLTLLQHVGSHDLPLHQGTKLPPPKKNTKKISKNKQTYKFLIMLPRGLNPWVSISPWFFCYWGDDE